MVHGILWRRNGEVVQEPAPHHGGKINYETFIEALHEIDYTGYLVSEYCLPLIKNHKIAGVEEVDRATIMAMRYMKELVAQVKFNKKITYLKDRLFKEAISKSAIRRYKCDNAFCSTNQIPIRNENKIDGHDVPPVFYLGIMVRYGRKLHEEPWDERHNLPRVYGKSYRFHRFTFLSRDDRGQFLFSTKSHGNDAYSQRRFLFSLLLAK